MYIAAYKYIGASFLYFISCTISGVEQFPTTVEDETAAVFQ